MRHKRDASTYRAQRRNAARRARREQRSKRPISVFMESFAASIRRVAQAREEAERARLEALKRDAAPATKPKRRRSTKSEAKPRSDNHAS